jgi:hypothetical protein
MGCAGTHRSAALGGLMRLPGLPGAGSIALRIYPGFAILLKVAVKSLKRDWAARGRAMRTTEVAESLWRYEKFVKGQAAPFTRAPGSLLRASDLGSDRRRCGTVFDAELCIYLLEMLVDSAGREAQDLRDVAVGLAFGQPRQHFALARR